MFNNLFTIQARQMMAQDVAIANRYEVDRLAQGATLVAQPGVTNLAIFQLGDGSLRPALDFSGSLNYPGKPVLLTGGVVQTKSGSAT